MARPVLSRLLGGAASVFGASLISFVFLRLLPSNPARLLLGPLASQASVDSLEDQLGLNRGIPAQYWTYVSRFFTGDWGFSYVNGRSVRTEIGARLPASLELGLFGLALALLFAVLLALLTTYRRRPVIEGATRGLAFVGLGTPPFWLALMALVVFVAGLGVLPGPDGQLAAGVTPPAKVTGFLTVDALLAGNLAAFWDALEHLLLPGLVLALGSFAFVVRLLRANLVDVSHEPFLLVARGRGLSRWAAASRHALPNALLPTLTTTGLLLAQLLAGSVFVEKIFNWPGVGALVVDSVSNQDYGVVQTFVLLSACAYVAINLVVDVLSGVLDPRVRKARGA